MLLMRREIQRQIHRRLLSCMPVEKHTKFRDAVSQMLSLDEHMMFKDVW